MAGTKEVLKEWIVGYMKSRDVITQHIKSIKSDSENADVFIEGALKNQYVIIQPELSDLSRLDSLKDKHIVLVTANTKENAEFLISNWQELVKYPHLSVYFVNPNSSLDKRWIILPATHDKITERKALRKGIESLYATVEPWKE
ncbi:MAG: hypothetical protein QXK08_00795 [Candidatus Woesearchaeota archaeon]